MRVDPRKYHLIKIRGISSTPESDFMPFTSQYPFPGPCPGNHYSDFCPQGLLLPVELCINRMASVTHHWVYDIHPCCV